jgi:flagellar assembly protein FliH
MNAFTAGFASRQVNAAEALARAFSRGEGFAAVDPRERVKGRASQSQPRHFEPAAPDAPKPTQGWDMFDTDVEQPATGGFVDPVATAHASGYAEGLKVAREEAVAAATRDRLLMEALAGAIAGAHHFDREAFARHLRQTVLALVERMVGDTGVPADLLARRVEAAVDLLADASESAIARLHPDDLALVKDHLPKTVFAIADAAVARGSFVLESASTIVEDGPDQWLNQLHQAIDRVPLPCP